MSATNTRPPGRPMSAEREQVLLDAALEVLRSVGYDKLTVVAVCELAGASTKTAYRRWANKDELLVAALRRAVERKVDGVPALIREDHLREALIANLQAQADSYRASANLVIGLLVASRVDGDLGAVARQVIRQHETTYCGVLLQDAVARGEARPDVDPEFVADLARSFFLHELLVRDEPPGRERILAFVDQVLVPLCATREA
ncbi:MULTISPECIES: TetR/AcrR family transcriptional regulator [Streptomyces]|uniref:TetR/AcrR family transcriptional regulator n=1 Tax=Streptomyces caniscabiei TaxID=2746961 RepID=A0ABU4MTB9_9ACTN|nr:MULTISPECIES: TetR/AcrR family transcriptional regulator [Streptomyces]MBE4737566.1 TetR/AcrR family transcriptional regulator [Streptomyces caniscabiei]MBE4756326.1 TetR/AcrR family transcriptional regulator [Streptomyces caniscabiei]MBE4769657.1 TetR/AcrR family transcriptional regulator [Streptomyces caniscabiei]MBE4787397.1 TetR/AcrR family transcriptional regulator [Streptomyces caniscabiei]MBE4795198.1 TetR/AcrR family transcriptional regulator [Streptomyces caniscabiei]